MAFDTISHGVLLDRLAGMGIGGTVLQWFRFYRADRVQKVVLEDSSSDPWHLRHGVPQGSILSPMLFNIYMKPLGKVVRRFGLRSQQYTDDTRLSVAILNSCLDSIMIWMRVNKLRLNPDKLDVLLVGAPPDRLKGHSPALDGFTLPLKDKVHSLGGAP